MGILVYKVLLGVLVISVMMAMLDRSVLIFIEENLPHVQKQHEAFLNKKELDKQIKDLKNNPIKEEGGVAPTMSDRNEMIINSLANAEPGRDMGHTYADSFCRTTTNAITKQEEKCKKLTPYNCKQVDCCILLNGAKCVSGGQDGPNFFHEDKKVGDDYHYYYKNKCYGEGC